MKKARGRLRRRSLAHVRTLASSLVRSSVRVHLVLAISPELDHIVREPAGAGDHLDASPDHQVSRNEQAVTGLLSCGDPALVPRTSPGTGRCLLSWQ